MNRADYSRLEDLRSRNELETLEILTAHPEDLLKRDPGNLTVGQLIAIGDLLNAYEALKSLRDDSGPSVSDVLPQFASPARAEKRTVRDYEQAPNPFGLTDEDRGSATDEERKAEALAMLKSLLSGDVPPDSMVQTVNGPMRYADIPRDENGVPVREWVDANCTCEEHERQRNTAAVADAFGNDRGGLYI